MGEGERDHSFARRIVSGDTMIVIPGLLF